MKTKSRLSKPYKLRIPLDLEAQLQGLAIDSGMTMSAVMRECLKKSRPVFKSRVPVTLQADRTRVLRYIYKAGNNLNQIARALNTLNAKGELSYNQSIKYLYLLDTIEARLSIFLQHFDLN